MDVDTLVVVGVETLDDVDTDDDVDTELDVDTLRQKGLIIISNVDLFEHHFLPSKEKIWSFLSFVFDYLEEVDTLDEVDTDEDDDTELEVDTLKGEIMDQFHLFISSAKRLSFLLKPLIAKQ